MYSNQLKVVPNYTNRTFLLYKDGTKYRTNEFSKEEFNDNLYNTQSDWSNFLKTTEDYYKVVR